LREPKSFIQQVKRRACILKNKKVMWPQTWLSRLSTKIFSKFVVYSAERGKAIANYFSRF